MYERQVLRMVRRRIAAPAPQPKQEPAAEEYSRTALEPHIDELCHDWARWSVTRKFYGAPPAATSVLAKFGRVDLQGPTPGYGPNAEASALLMRMHQAIVGGTGRARDAFEGYYLYRVRPIKKLAMALACHPVHVYRLRNEYARKVYALATK